MDFSQFSSPKQSHFRLKERNVQHLRIKDTADLRQVYDLEEQLGEGAFGVVTAVTEKKTSKQWAMKIVVKTQAGDRLKLVQREIQILKLIQHPHIIYLDRIYESPRKIYMIFERCHGSLLVLYEQERFFPESIAKKIARELCDAVAYLHKYDIVHRDLKMDNILTGTNPKDPKDKYYIKLTDFGLSIMKLGQGVESMLHEYCGTLIYMSPEMITTRSYSQQCDVWAIGIMIYMMVVGRHPFYSSDEEILKKNICNKEPDYTKHPHQKLTADVVSLIKELLVKDPVHRLTASEVLRNPWIHSDSQHTGGTNIVQMMKNWKSEMKVKTSAAESDWVSCTNDDEISRAQVSSKANKQPLVLPKTDIKFERHSSGNAHALVRGLSNKSQPKLDNVRRESPAAVEPNKRKKDKGKK